MDALGLREVDGPLVDVGCGYGTFTLAAARRSRHPVHALDIERAMVDRTASRAREAGLVNVRAAVIDVTSGGLGFPAGTAAVVLLFNLLHCEDPHAILGATLSALRPGGRVAAIHWRSDVQTPRGPDPSIRPRPEALRALLIEAGFEIVVEPVVLPPYHVGIVGRRAVSAAPS